MYQFPDLLSSIQFAVAACLVCCPLEDGVGEGGVAVRTDVGVSLFLVPRVSHFRDIVPVFIGDVGQCPLRVHVCVCVCVCLCVCERESDISRYGNSNTNP